MGRGKLVKQHWLKTSLISPNGIITYIEIKYATVPSITKGFYQSMEDLKPAYQYIIVPSGSPYFFNDRLKVCSLQDFLDHELMQIL